MNWPVIISSLLSAGVGGIIMYLLGWIRFRRKDSASIGLINAEAQEIRAKADVLITDGALRIVERLSKDLDEARDEIEKLMVIIADAKAINEKHRSEYENEVTDLRGKLREAKDLIETKRRHCINIKARLVKLQELLQLKQKGLSQEQLDDFIKALTELITFSEDY